MIDGPPPDPPLVSVIVPVFNNAGPLGACLRALRDQTLPRAEFEVIVVDNGSSDEWQRVTAEHPAVRVGIEPAPGPYAARNRGLSLARGRIVAFTDSDCVPAPSWLARGVAHLRRDDRAVLAGRIAVQFEHPAAPTAVEIYEGFTALQQQRFVEHGGFGATANLFAARSVFERVGPFDGSVKSGGDVEWCQRAVAAGYRLRYADDVCVSHPARRTLRELHRKVARTIGGAHDLKGRARFLGIDRPPIGDWIPPVRYAWRAWQSPMLPGVARKLRVAGVMFFVRYVEAVERLRLRLGGASRR